ncbi:hypothetical protein [Streptomyces sp. NPDC047009]
MSDQEWAAVLPLLPVPGWMRGRDNVQLPILSGSASGRSTVHLDAGVITR